MLCCSVVLYCVVLRCVVLMYVVSRGCGFCVLPVLRAGGSFLKKKTQHLGVFGDPCTPMLSTIEDKMKLFAT